MEIGDQLKVMGVSHFYEIFRDDDQTNIVDQLKVVHLFPAFLSSEEADIFCCEITLDEFEGL